MVLYLQRLVFRYKNINLLIVVVFIFIGSLFISCWWLHFTLSAWKVWINQYLVLTSGITMCSLFCINILYLLFIVHICATVIVAYKHEVVAWTAPANSGLYISLCVCVCVCVCVCMCLSMCIMCVWMCVQVCVMCILSIKH